MELGFSAIRKIVAWLFGRPEKKSSLVLKVSITSLIIIGVALLYYINAWDSLEGFVVAMDHTNVLFGDFVRHFYPMGKEIFITHLPYFGYYYPPFFAIFLSLFGLFTPKTAFWLWGACQLAAIASLVVIPGLHFLRKSLLAFYLYLLLVITSLPVLHNLRWGQVTVPLIAMVLISLFLYRKKYPVLAGIFLALSAAVKYFTGIFLLYPLFKKDIRYIATFLISSIIFWFAIPFIFLGVADSLTFYKAVSDLISGSRAWVSTDINSQYFVHVASRIFQSNSAASVLAVVGYAIVAFNTVLVYLMVRKKLEQDSIWAFVLLFASLPFILRTSWPHYFAYLPFCQVFVGMILFTGKSTNRIHSWAKAILLLIPSVLLSNIVFFNIINDRIAYGGWGCLFFANMLLLILIYLQALPEILSKKKIKEDQPVAPTRVV
jgi:hypothetical protein